MTALRLADLPDWPALLDVEAAAAYLSISESHLLVLRHRHGFPAAMLGLGRRLLWRRADLDAWLARPQLDGQAQPVSVGGLQGWD